MTAPQTTMVSASIIGQVTSQATGKPVTGAHVIIEWYNGSAWVIPAVNGRTDQRADDIQTAGVFDDGSEINEGGFVINQLPPNTSYRLTISKSGYTTQQVTVSVTTGITSLQSIAL